MPTDNDAGSPVVMSALTDAWYPAKAAAEAGGAPAEPRMVSMSDGPVLVADDEQAPSTATEATMMNKDDRLERCDMK
ncbi:MAG: hypothetical protein M3081_16860 [Gemmatimonadota bacterium]|nr:hypothetical protein [Gemmatimonadota bacterium]